MFKNLLYSMFAVGLFASGAVGAWYFLEFTQKQQAQAETAPDPAAEARLESRPTEQDLPLFSDGGEADRLPVPVHAKVTSAEDIFRWEQMNGEAELELKRQRELLKQEESRLKTTHKDLEAQHRELEGQYLQIQEALATAEKMVTRIQKAAEGLKAEKEALDKQRAETEKSTQGANVERETNIKSMANLVQGMPPERAAETIEGLVRDGKLALVLQMLRNIEPRNAAKILGNISDNEILMELIAAFPEQRLPKANIVR